MSTSAGNRMEAMLADQEITGRILLIRGQRVMLDRDLAQLYGMLPFRLREQVKRNLERFPKNFMFQMTAKELREMVSQFAIPSHTYAGGSVPYAFTEHGVLMLANVLRSERAVQMSSASSSCSCACGRWSSPIRTSSTSSNASRRKWPRTMRTSVRSSITSAKC